MEMNKIKNMSVNSKNIMHPELKIDFQVLRKSVLVLRAVNHKLRHEMIRLIHREGKMTVTDLYVKLRLEQSVASQHLALLRRAGVVTTSRDGKFIYYSVNTDRLQEVNYSVAHERMDEISRLLEELVK